MFAQYSRPYEGLGKPVEDMCLSWNKTLLSLLQEDVIGLRVAVRSELLYWDISHSVCELAKRQTFLI